MKRALHGSYRAMPLVRRLVNARRHRRYVACQVKTLQPYRDLFSVRRQRSWLGDTWTVQSTLEPLLGMRFGFAFAYDFRRWAWRVEHCGRTVRTDKVPLWECLNFYGYLLALAPSRGDVVLDVGAADGLSSCLFSAHVGREGKVVAVEPDPLFQQAIRQTIVRNDWVNCELAPWALGPVTRMVRFVPRGNAGRVLDAECQAEQGIEQQGSIRVPQRSLRRCVDELARARTDARLLLKFDVEGYELELLDSIVDVVSADRSAIAAIASYHIVDGRPTCETIHDRLRGLDPVACVTTYPLHTTTLIVNRANSSEFERLKKLRSAASATAVRWAA